MWLSLTTNRKMGSEIQSPQTSVHLHVDDTENSLHSWGKLLLSLNLSKYSLSDRVILCFVFISFPFQHIRNVTILLIDAFELKLWRIVISFFKNIVCMQSTLWHQVTTPEKRTALLVYYCKLRRREVVLWTVITYM